MNLNNLNEVISISSLVTAVGVVFKFVSYIKTQAVKEENLKNKILNLEEKVSKNEGFVLNLQDKTDAEFKAILDKIDKNSELHTKKIDEIKNLIINLVKE